MSVLQGTTFAAEVIDPDGTDLSSATITCTVTAPDLTTATYSTDASTVTVTGSKATANVPAVQVGTYLLVWSLSGTVSGSVADQFTVEAASIDLLSLTDLKDELNLSATDFSKDAKLRRWLKSATKVVENVTGPVAAQATVEYFDGDVASVVLASRWVSAIGSVVETWGATNYTLTEQPLGASVDAFGYTWDRATNTITRRVYGGAPALFQPGIRTVKVAYTAGMLTVPDDIQLAAARLIGHWYRKNEVAFRTSAFNAQGGDDAFNLPGNYMVPNEVMELLEPWRRPPGIF